MKKVFSCQRFVDLEFGNVCSLNNIHNISISQCEGIFHFYSDFQISANFYRFHRLVLHVSKKAEAAVSDIKMIENIAREMARWSWEEWLILCTRTHNHISQRGSQKIMDSSKVMGFLW